MNVHRVRGYDKELKEFINLLKNHNEKIKYRLGIEVK